LLAPFYLEKAMSEKLVKCVILRDFWDNDGKRHTAGTEVDLPVEAALDGVESGSLARVKEAKK
jgi:hypothetical protein